MQDLPFVVEHGQKACPARFRDRIAFQSQNMLSSQSKFDLPSDTRLVFLLKIILHDHKDEYCKLILRNLLSTMNAVDKILIIDTVTTDTGGSLSSNMSDLIILSMFGSHHRILDDFRALLDDCGEDL